MLSPPFLLFDSSLSLIFYNPSCCISTHPTKFLNPFLTFIIRKGDIQNNIKPLFIFLQRISQLNCRNRPYYAENDTSMNCNNQDYKIRTRFSPFLFHFFRKKCYTRIVSIPIQRIKEQ